jgi:hypothetical protein
MDILNPGPISNGRWLNRARFATCFELMSEMRFAKREIPSAPDDLKLDGAKARSSPSAGSR